MSKVKKCPGKEGFQRLNYLYQVANLFRGYNQTKTAVANFYSNLMINVSKKTVQRLDIPIKRTICKKCRSLLLVGITSKVRVKKKRIINRCLKCNTSKTYSTEKGEYLTWTQTKESHVEILDYTPEDQSKIGK